MAWGNFTAYERRKSSQTHMLLKHLMLESSKVPYGPMHALAGRRSCLSTKDAQIVIRGTDKEVVRVVCPLQ